MEKDIQEIKISIARIETTQGHLCKKMDELNGSIPVCEKSVIKERISMNRKLFWFIFILLMGGMVSYFIKDALAKII